MVREERAEGRWMWEAMVLRWVPTALRVGEVVEELRLDHTMRAWATVRRRAGG